MRQRGRVRVACTGPLCSVTRVAVSPDAPCMRRPMPTYAAPCRHAHASDAKVSASPDAHSLEPRRSLR
eukprot:568764-Rhodomonas_salina.1